MRMRARSGQLAVVGILAIMIPAIADEQVVPTEAPKLRATLIEASDASPERLTAIRSSGMNTVVFSLTHSSDQAKTTLRTATANAKQAGLMFAYWVEVARSPELADEHPEWMASLQTHDEWRRLFPDTPLPRTDQVAKTYPWVPILSREPFDAQLKRIRALLADLPAAELIFLNDVQGAPSACGCGNSLCRWTSDYGKKRTTVPLGDEAAALFISRIQEVSPNSEVIPVWTTECEEHDGDPDGLCAGVGCFKGICWKAYTRQLMPVAKACDRIAVLALYKEFQRDTPRYGSDTASWVEFAISTFESIPPQHHGTAIPSSRVIAVLQGWDVTEEEVDAQRRAATKSGASGYVVARKKLDQSWTPKIVPWK